MFSVNKSNIRNKRSKFTHWTLRHKKTKDKRDLIDYPW